MNYRVIALFSITFFMSLLSCDCFASRESLASALSHYSTQSLTVASHAARTVSGKALQYGNKLAVVMLNHPRLTCLCVAALLIAYPGVRSRLINGSWNGVRKAGSFIRMGIIERIKAMLFTDVNERLDKTNLVLVNHTNKLDFIATVVQNLQEQMAVVQAQLRTMGIDLAGVKTNTEKLKGIEESLSRLDSHNDKAFAVLAELRGQVSSLQLAIAKFDGSYAAIEQIKQGQETLTKQFTDGLQAILLCMNLQKNITGAVK